MKKIISFILIFSLLILPIMPMNFAYAASGATITVTDANGSRGDTIKVSVKISKNSGIQALGFDFKYDKNVFELVSASRGAAISSAQAIINTSSLGKVVFSMVSAGSALSASGSLLDVELKIKSNAAYGNSSLSVNLKEASDGSFNAIEVSTVDGTVTVNAPQLDAPENLYPVQTYSNAVTVAWDYVEEASGYNIYLNGKKFNEEDIIDPSYTIFGLEPDTAYQIHVTSINYTTESNLSDVLEVSTLPIQYTVTFITEEHEIIESFIVDEGNAILPPSAPEKEGYAFDAWRIFSFDSTRGTVVDDFSSITQHMTLRASYIKSVLTVKFVDWDGTVISEQTVNYGESATAPEIPTRDGYIFTVWDKAFDNVTEDLTVQALYAEIICEHTKTEIRDYSAPTCNTTGYSGDTWCVDCDTMLESGKTLDATGVHVDADGKWESNDTQHFRTCSCGAKFDYANHTGGEASCMSKAVCSVCNVEYGTNNSNHSLVELVRVNATSTTDGYVIYECERGCGYMKKEVLPKVDASIPVAKLVSSAFDSLTINWKAYAGATRYYLVVTNADGFKYSTNTTNTQITIKNLAANTEYSIKIRVGYNNDNSVTSYGAIVNFKTAKDDKTRLTLANNADGQSIDVTIVNFVEGETYYIYRSTESGNKLVGTTKTNTCTVKAVVGDNTLYAKAASTYLNTAKVKIRVYKADVKLVVSAKGGAGYANLTVSSIVEVKNYYYYRMVNGKAKLVKSSNSRYYTADAFKGLNSYLVKADVVYPDGTEGVISSNTITVDIETPAMTLTCTKKWSTVEIKVKSDFVITAIWIYRINADGKSTLLEATDHLTTYLPNSWGTTFKVKVRVHINGNAMYLGSDNVTVS